MVSSELSGREGARGTSAYRHHIQEASSTLRLLSQRAMKWNTLHVTQGFGWFCGSREPMMITTPRDAVAPKVLSSPQRTEQSAAPVVFFTVIICQSYLQTAFCKFPLLKRPSAGDSPVPDSSLKFRTMRARQSAEGSMAFSFSVGGDVNHRYLGTACLSPATSQHTHIYFNGDSKVVCYL